MLLLTIAKYETPSGRLIQRDYSNGDLYSYYTEGGSFRNDDNGGIPQSKGAESKTDTGRSVYSGGGINPDVVIKPDTITLERARQQQKLNSPITAFAMDLAQGKVKGFESYKVTYPAQYGYDLKDTDYAMTDAVFAAFKQYASEKYKVSAAQLDREREFVDRTLRGELVTAAYGSNTSLRILDAYDDQLLKAIDQLPQARALALKADRVHSGGTSALNGNQ
jgi:carboxyl-terminal processing protease